MYNKVILIGRLIENPKLLQSQTGTNYCRFTLAVNRWSQSKQQTDFINCVCFSNLATNMDNYCQKGSLVLIDGYIQTSQQEQNGRINYYTSVICNLIKFLSPKNKVKNDLENENNLNFVENDEISKKNNDKIAEQIKKEVSDELDKNNESVTFAEDIDWGE